jgi:three-Cys-motif partner protein
MPTGDLIIGSDGEITLVVGRWSKDKLFYIKRYCDIFNAGMKDRWTVRTYVDLFSGPGECSIETTKEEIEGSPLLALGCKVPFTHYFFNDIQPNFIKSLKARVAPYHPNNVTCFNKDCNLAVDELLQKLPPASLDFCFIDPFRWEISFNSIRKLTEGRRMDLAITFHVGNMKRVAHNPPQELIDFSPNRSWQQEYEKAEITGKLRGHILLEAYKSGLADLGYKDIRDYVLEVNRNNVPLYNLIFASKHRRGADFWDKIAVRSETGQIRMLMVREKGDRREDA